MLRFACLVFVCLLTSPAIAASCDLGFDLTPDGSNCIKHGNVYCGNGMSCPSGSACEKQSDGSMACMGYFLDKGGPLCASGRHCRSGELCMPNDRPGCYDPKVEHPCPDGSGKVCNN